MILSLCNIDCIRDSATGLKMNLLKQRVLDFLNAFLTSLNCHSFLPDMHMCYPFLWLKEGERYWNKASVLNVTRLVSSSAASQVGIANEISRGSLIEATIGTPQITSFCILNLAQLSMASWHLIKPKTEAGVLILNVKRSAPFVTEFSLGCWPWSHKILVPIVSQWKVFCFSLMYWSSS